MGKIYPYWLGYKHRNDKKNRLNPVEEIKKEIARDKAFYECLPANSRKRKMASFYNFDAISPEKVEMFFNGKRGMTPYEFAKINFEDKRFVYKDEYLTKYQEDDAR